MSDYLYRDLLPTFLFPIPCFPCLGDVQAAYKETATATKIETGEGRGQVHGHICLQGHMHKLCFWAVVCVNMHASTVLKGPA